MKLTIDFTSRMKKDVKRIKKQGKNLALLYNTIEKLANQESLDERYRDHSLTGDYQGCRECHITPDWLLVYMIDNEELILVLTRTGSHSELF